MDTSGRVIAEQVVVISIAVLAFVVPSIIYVVTIYWGGISKRLLLSTSSSTTASPTHPPPASSAPRRRPDHVKITNHKSKLSHPAPLPPYPPSINHRPSLRDLKKSQQKRLGGEKSIGGGGSSGGASRYNLSNHTPLPPRSSNTTTTLPSPNTNNTIITAKLQNLSSAQESVSFWSRIFTKSSWLWFTGPPVLPPDPQIVNPTTGDASNNNFSTNEFSALASADTSSIHLPQTNVIHVKSATSDKDHHHPPPPSLPSAPVKQLQMRPMTDSSGIMSMAGNLVSVGPGIYHHQQQHPHLPPPLSQPPPNSILLSNNAHHTHHGSVALSTSTGVIQEPHFVINNTHQYHHQTHQQHLHFVTPPQYPYPPHLIPSYSSRIHSRFQSYSEISFPNTSSHNLPLSRLPYSYSVASTTTSSITRLFHEAAPALLSFSDIIYSVKTSHNGPSKKFKTSSSSTTTILKSVNGFMKAGSLTAIMGPSGCGKTTLLDILAGRKYSGEISGSIMINGKPRNNATFKRISAYVQQDDALFSFLTVKEILLYTSELRISAHIPPEEKLQKVEKVMEDLDLMSIANKRIGDERSGGLSRGQRRRVTVAIELITSPSIIFLDEPTSGLDAYSSLKLMKLLKKLAHRGGRTIICTIHQPRSDIFQMFDTLYMMVAGEVAFFGPVDGIADYFNKIGSSIPPNTNPADFIVDLTHDVEEEVKEGEDDDADRKFYTEDGRHHREKREDTSAAATTAKREDTSAAATTAILDPLVSGVSALFNQVIDLENQATIPGERDDWVAFENKFYQDKKKHSPLASTVNNNNNDSTAATKQRQGAAGTALIALDGSIPVNSKSTEDARQASNKSPSPRKTNQNGGGGGSVSKASGKRTTDSLGSPKLIASKKKAVTGVGSSSGGELKNGSKADDKNISRGFSAGEDRLEYDNFLVEAIPLQTPNLKMVLNKSIAEKVKDKFSHLFSKSSSNDILPHANAISVDSIKLPPIDSKFKGVVAATSTLSNKDDIHVQSKDLPLLEKNWSSSALDHDDTEIDGGKGSGDALVSTKDRLPEKYRVSTLAADNDKELSLIRQGLHLQITGCKNESTLLLNHQKASFAVGMSRQVSLILQRSHINNMRNPGFFVAWIVGGISFLFYGLIYLGLRTSNLVQRVQSGDIPTGDTTSIDYWDSQRSFIFQIITAIVFLQLETLTSAHLEKRLFYREFASGAYSSLAYHIAWVLRTCCYGLLRGILFPPLVYFMSGLTISFTNYAVFTIVFCIMDAIGSSLALLLVCSVPTLESSSSAFTTFTSFIATACGFFLRPNLIPVWFIWVYNISWYKYALDALYLNEFDGKVDPATGLSVIDAFFEVDTKLDKWMDILVLFLYPIAFHLLSWYASWHYTRPKEIVSKPESTS